MKTTSDPKPSEAFPESADIDAGDPIPCNVNDMTLTDTQKELAVCAIKKIKGTQNSSAIVVLFKCEADALIAFVKGIDT